MGWDGQRSAPVSLSQGAVGCPAPGGSSVMVAAPPSLKGLILFLWSAAVNSQGTPASFLQDPGDHVPLCFPQPPRARTVYMWSSWEGSPGGGSSRSNSQSPSPESDSWGLGGLEGRRRNLQLLLNSDSPTPQSPVGGHRPDSVLHLYSQLLKPPYNSESHGQATVQASWGTQLRAASLCPRTSPRPLPELLNV